MDQTGFHSDQRFRDFFENINIGLTICDATGRFLNVNKPFCTLTGYKQEALHKLTFKDITHPDDLAVELSMLKAAIKNKSDQYSIEKRYIRKDRSVFWVELIVSILRDEKNKPVQFIGTVQDITARKEAELLLDINRERLEQAIRVTNIGIFDHNHIEDTIYWSPRQREIYNVDKDTVITLELYLEFIYPEDHERIFDAVKKAHDPNGDGFFDVVHRIKRKDGTVRWIDTRSKTFFRGRGKDKHPVRTVGAVKDITEQKIAESELIAAKEKAEESDRLKTSFLQNMSHEIRTPLNAIMGFSSLLAEEFDDKEQLEYLTKIIIQRGSDLLEIVNGILDLTIIESGQLSLNYEEYKLTHLFKEIESIYIDYRTRNSKEDIPLKLKLLYCDNDSIFYSDQGKLKQVLINLINNAYKFTSNGEIELCCDQVNPGELIFYVRDTGIGIPPEKQEEIFKRFVQLDSESSRLYGGTGLGLSIVKGLVGLLGGEIQVESGPGKGSKFYFTLPIKPIPSKHREKEGTAKGDTTGHDDFSETSVLVVEDDKFNTIYLKKVLSGFNFRQYYAETGKDAVDIALNNHIDLVLMDIRLPDISGYEATRQIKQRKPGIYILAQTAYSTEADRDKAFAAGCNDYISKPINRDLLINKLKSFNKT